MRKVKIVLTVLVIEEIACGRAWPEAEQTQAPTSDLAVVVQNMSQATVFAVAA